MSDFDESLVANVVTGLVSSTCVHDVKLGDFCEVCWQHAVNDYRRALSESDAPVDEGAYMRIVARWNAEL